MAKKIIVIGGGAGGGSFAARIRRHDNDAKITIYERSPFVSYSNCGQPYLISGEKPDFESIIVYSPQDWKEQYEVNAKVSHEVIKINRLKKEVTVKNLLTNEEFKDNYDILAIAPGSPALKLSIPGIEKANNIHVLKTPDQLQKIMTNLNKGVKKAVVIGGGYIGLEIAENCRKINLDVTLIDAAKTLLSKSVDEDFSVFINQALIENKINLKLNKNVKAIKDKGQKVILDDEEEIASDIIFMVAGVAPELQMYQEAGLVIGASTGGLKVNKYSQTNDPSIYAIGDIAQTYDWLGNPSRIQLAIIAQRMATVGANHVYGFKDHFKGVQNSAAISIFDTSVAAVGYSESELKNKKISYQKVIGIEQHAVLHGENIYLKVMYDAKGLILGAQAAGPFGAEKRINYIAMAQMYNIPIEELLHFQVAYNPVVDTQRDPANLVARIARAQNQKITENITIMEMAKYLQEGYTLLDVRTKEEYDLGHIEGAKLLPLQQLTAKMKNLDPNGKYLIYCRRGARAYNFQLRLKNAGFKNVINILGAWDHYAVYNRFCFKNLTKEVKK